MKEIFAWIGYGFIIGCFFSIIIIKYFPSDETYGLGVSGVELVQQKKICQAKLPRNQECVLDVKFKIVTKEN